MKTNLTIILFFFWLAVNGQESKRLVMDSVTKKPIAFATIKVLGRPGGVIASENGVFDLFISPSDSVQFSCVGYKKKMLAGSTITDSIYLAPEYKSLKNFTIQKQKVLQTLFLGNDSLKINKQLVWGPGGKAEFVQRIDLPDSTRSYRLKKVFLRIRKHDCYGALLLHIYEPDPATGLPGEELFMEPVSFDKKNIRKNRATIDLSMKNIFIYDQKSFYVSISWLPNAANEQCLSTIYFVPAADSKTFHRTIISNDYNWFPFYFGKDKDGAPTRATILLSIEVSQIDHG